MDTGASSTPAGTAGAAEGAVAATPTALDYASFSDDQILDDGFEGEGSDDAGSDDLGDELAEQSDADDDGQDEGTDEDADTDHTDESDEDDEEEEPVEDESEDEDEADDTDEEPSEDLGKDQTDPAELKDVFKKHPVLRQAYYSDQAFREQFPTVAEAREYREKLPTLEDVTQAVEARGTVESYDQAFYSDDPKQQQQFFTNLHGQDADRFYSLAQQFPAVLAQLDKSKYTEIVARPVVMGTLDNLMQLAASKNDDNLKAAVEVLARRLFGTPHAEMRKAVEPSAREKQLMAELERVKGTSSEQKQTTEKNFLAALDQESMTRITKGAKAALTNATNGLLKGTVFATNEKVQNNIVGEIYTEIAQTMAKTDSFKSAYQRTLQQVRKGSLDQGAAKTQLLKLFTDHANKLLPAAAKKVVETYTGQTVSKQAAKLNAAQRNAKRPDITGGTGKGKSQTSSTGPKFKPSEIDYSSSSDDDILEDRPQLRGKKK